jgi:hypothetical protein
MPGILEKPVRDKNIINLSQKVSTLFKRGEDQDSLRAKGQSSRVKNITLLFCFY